jgi:hypothetical protein
MFQLYNKKNISILWGNKKNKISVNFCNIDMKLKNCQFRLFYYYLNCKSKEINGKIKNVELQLVKENLKVEVSLNDFFHLLNGVEMVMKERFGYNHNKKD